MFSFMLNNVDIFYMHVICNGIISNIEQLLLRTLAFNCKNRYAISCVSKLYETCSLTECDIYIADDSSWSWYSMSSVRSNHMKSVNVVVVSIFDWDLFVEYFTKTMGFETIYELLQKKLLQSGFEIHPFLVCDFPALVIDQYLSIDTTCLDFMV
jgi:hypothetical protein